MWKTSGEIVHFRDKERKTEKYERREGVKYLMSFDIYKNIYTHLEQKDL